MNRFLLGSLLILGMLPAPATRADFHIRSPYEIDYGTWEFEHNGAASFDHLPDRSGAQSYTLELGTGVTPWWHTEIEFSFNRDPGLGEPTLLSGVVTENLFQLTEPGEHFADFGFYAEYGQSLTTGRYAGPNAFTFGPVIARDIGPTSHTVNLFLTQQLGPNQTTHGLDFTYAWQSRWNLSRPLSPAIEIYGDSGVLARSPRLSRQQLLVGPVAVGALSLHQLGLSKAGKIQYEIGWLFGATEATAKGTLRWRLELEFPF